MIIDEQYNEIMQPDKFVESFDTMACFENWCLTGDVLDLQEALSVFEAYELYEYCAVIKKVIDYKSC